MSLDLAVIGTLLRWIAERAYGHPVSLDLAVIGTLLRWIAERPMATQ